jgi:hypothetical protein
MGDIACQEVVYKLVHRADKADFAPESALTFLTVVSSRSHAITKTTPKYLLIMVCVETATRWDKPGEYFRPATAFEGSCQVPRPQQQGKFRSTADYGNGRARGTSYEFAILVGNCHL